jgi:hypothetical protein
MAMNPCFYHTQKVLPYTQVGTSVLQGLLHQDGSWEGAGSFDQEEGTMMVGI